MPDQEFELDVLRDLLEEARALASSQKTKMRFAKPTRRSARAMSASDSKTCLSRAPPPGCGLICEWIRIKECIFVCLKLCGSPESRLIGSQTRANWRRQSFALPPTKGWSGS